MRHWKTHPLESRGWCQVFSSIKKLLLQTLSLYLFNLLNCNKKFVLFACKKREYMDFCKADIYCLILWAAVRPEREEPSSSNNCETKTNLQKSCTCKHTHTQLSSFWGSSALFLLSSSESGGYMTQPHIVIINTWLLWWSNCIRFFPPKSGQD